MLERALIALVYGAAIEAHRRRDFEQRTEAHRWSCTINRQAMSEAHYRARWVHFYQQLGKHLEYRT